MVTRDEIRLAYQLLLGREPEDEGCYVHHATHADVVALGRCVLQSQEGVWRMRELLREARLERSFDFFRSQIVFIHLEKVGGTSLYESLASQFRPDTASRPHLDCIPDCTMAELNDYDFVSGHFSYQEAMALPRSPKTFIIVFRQPFARLISFYRFHRAHPDAFRSNPIVDLAKRLSPEEFFRHRFSQTSPRTNNAYLQCLAGLPGNAVLVDPTSQSQGIDLAFRRLNDMAAIGLTENMPGTVRLIAAATGIAVPDDLTRLNTTSDLHKQGAGFEDVAEIEVTPALRETIAPLIEHDLRIYEKASVLFHDRLATLNADTDRAAGPAPWRIASPAIASPLAALRKTAAQAKSVIFTRR